MTSIKLPIQLTTLICSLAFTTVVLAEEANVNENKTDGTVNAISNVDATDTTAGSNGQTIKAETDSIPDGQIQLSQETFMNDMKEFQQMEKDWYQQRRETRRKQMEERSNQLKTDAETERNEYIKHMEMRREFFNKLNEKRRNELEQKIEEMRLKTLRTCTDNTAVKES